MPRRGFPSWWFEGGNDLIVGVSGLAGFVVLLLANIGLFCFDRRFSTGAVVKEASRNAESPRTIYVRAESE
jgi:hypothetical protein